MSASVHVALRGIVFSGVSGWPLPQRAPEGNDWVTGRCWLYCRRENVSVLWIGPLRTPSVEGELYACGQCIAELVSMAREEQRRRDLPEHQVCEHRELERREGKTFCSGCARQIYL
ncbi:MULTISPECIES: hypothetical protein [unclassified Streptomyces]|uniref:Uncharacterized protein n=1 Tax=Streptomyces johnsoniae TaxID=3075532 RepID=A0ABU2SEI3_9ACTN|nr:MULTISPECIES: hypothetical protein [unclassified Streptomyces]MDT0447381.1 hypothetical protein [Streptomyces sp. DSM 41886]